MAANTSPIFSASGIIQTSTITNSATALTTSNGAATTGISGTSGEMFVVGTGGTNGSYLQRLRLRWTGSTANTATTATIVRIYVSTVSSGATTSSNTFCIEEVLMGVQTADGNAAATFPYDIPLNFILPSGSYLLASVHQKPAATTEICMTLYGGDY